MIEPYIVMKDVTKVFPGVVAMDHMNLELRPGQVHGLIGENGAGKSTLIKVLTGVHTPEEGQVFIGGRETQLQNPKHAMSLGISCIYQELNIVQQLPVVDNIFLGREIRQPSKLLDYTAMIAKARSLLQGLGQDIDPTVPIDRLGIGHQQMCEIAKALSVETKILIMDEPTSSLSNNEVQELVKTVRHLKSEGVGTLFVSHKLEEVFEICDVVTIMRDGQYVGTFPVGDDQ
jgi:ribose transport system ATP-binding protein